MATEAAIVTKDWEPAAKKFVQQASADHLQQIAAGTLLSRHPQIASAKGTAEEKTESLRKLIAHEMKRHADFRGMVIRLLAQKGLVSPPVKEVKEAKEAKEPKEGKKEGKKEAKEAKEAAGGEKEAKEGKEGQKPKKEKRPEGEGGKPSGEKPADSK